MTEFLPGGDASPTTPTTPTAPAPPMSSPSAVPAPAPAYDYASAPPPLFSDVAVRRFRWRRAIWGLLLVIAAPIVTVMGISTVMGQADPASNFSPDYSGTPVEASDASATTIVSQDSTIAYDIGADWIDGSDYIDVKGATAGLAPGQALIGTHLTADPNATTPQLVMVTGGSPSATLTGSLEDVLTGYLAGARKSGVSFDEPQLTPVTTANGLEGYSVAFEATAGTSTANMAVAALGHGQRVVIVQWSAFQAPVDASAQQRLLDSLRIDE